MTCQTGWPCTGELEERIADLERDLKAWRDWGTAVKEASEPKMGGCRICGWYPHRVCPIPQMPKEETT